jgi:hypothetical protein
VASPKSLREQLYQSAEGFGRSALRAFLAGDWAVFMLHSGTALEQLTKAYLADLNPGLIAGRDFDSLLHAHGLGQHAAHSRLRMKTITLTEALDRSGQLIPTIPPLRDGLRLLVDVRNGVAHAGFVDQAAAERVLVPFLRACSELLPRIRVEPSVFWADLTDMVETRLSASAAAAEIRAREAITAAQHAFEGRYSAMDDGVRKAVLKAVQETYTPDRYEQNLIDCPSCGYAALVSGTNDVDWEADWEIGDLGESYIAGAYPIVKLVPYHLQCRICGLELDGADELAAAGLERSWVLEDVDAEDFYEAELYDE